MDTSEFSCQCQSFLNIHSLKLIASLPLKIGQGPQKEREKVFQASIFWCFLLLVSGQVKQRIETKTT